MANKQHPTRAARSSSPAKSSASLTVDGISLEVQPERPKRGKRKLDGHAASKSSVKRQKASAALGPIKNNDYCESCGLPGRFLCCDACPKAFHFTCVDPPMDDKDVEHLEGEWFCRECQSKRDHTGASSPNAVSPILPGIRGVFDTLTHKLRMQNPKAFKLPKEIWGSFDGVGTDKYGQFVDTSVIKPPKQRVENIDTRPLKDKNGNFMLCFRCRKTALNKRMISCDYCPLHWHLDCTDPPMVAPPNPARKWMCPCHIEHVLPKKRFRKSNQGQRIEIYDDEEKAAIPENEKRKGKRRAVIGPLAQEEMPDHIIPYNKIVYRIPASAIKMDFWLQRLKRAAKTGPAQQRRQQSTNVSRASTSNSSHSLSNSQQRRTVSSLSPAIIPTRSTTTTTVPVPAPVASSSSPSSLQSAMRAPQQPSPASNSSPIKNKMTKVEAKQWLQNIAKFQAEVAKFIEEEYGPSDDEEASNAAQP